MAFKFNELAPAARAAVIGAVMIDAGLRFWAVSDLRSREKSEINGSKTAWTLALGFVNSAGVVPLVYLVKGRRAKAVDEVGAR